MLIDKFREITNKRFLPTYEYDDMLLKNVRLYRALKKAHDILPQYLPDEYFENFFLPSPITGIEDSASLVILADEGDNWKGLHYKRNFVEFLSSHAPSDAFEDGKSDDIEKQLRDSEEYFMISYGEIGPIEACNNKFHAPVRLKRVTVTYIDRLHHSNALLESKIQTLQEIAGKNPLIALQQIAYINSKRAIVRIAE